LFKKNNNDGYEYLFSFKEEELDQWFEVNKEELAESSITPAWKESERSS